MKEEEEEKRKSDRQNGEKITKMNEGRKEGNISEKSRKKTTEKERRKEG